jgi:hypothetical protein
VIRFSAVLAFGAVVVAGCSDDPPCVIDTDCPLGEYCSAEQRCEVVGGQRDAAVVDAGEPMDSGPEDSGPMDAGVDSGPEMIGVGSVVASSQAASYSVIASFSLLTGPSACTVTEVSDACRLTACPPPVMVMDAGVPDAGMEDAGMPVAPNAGVITIAGGASEMVTLTPDAMGLYPVATGTMPLWPSSDAVLTVMGAGAEAPMFGVSLPGPDAVALTAPAGGSIPVASDLTVTWSGSTPGEVVASLSASREGSFSLECRFEPAAGTGVIPASALMEIGVGAGFLSLRSEQSRTITRSGWDISVALQAPGAATVVTLE